MGFRTSSNCAVDPNLLSTRNRVESIIFSILQKTKPVAGIGTKMGLELEFFLERADGEKISMTDSRNFMLAVSDLRGWKLFPEEGKPDSVSKVSFEIPGVGYHSLKYEHPPHMLEIAFAPFSNLHEFYESLLSVWSDFETAAKRAEVLLKFSSTIAAPTIDWEEISKFNSKYQALAITRERMVELKDQNESWVHFTTYTAATQFHIGGSEWWNNDGQLVNRLYRAELLTGSNAHNLLGMKNANQIKESFNRRWNGYFQVFQKMALMGFPKFETWNVRSWIEQFCQSSLVLLESDPFFGKNLDDIGNVLSDGELTRAIHCVRDLQIVKPKLIGTLELRADPALPSPEAIIRQAALRLGVHHYCLLPHANIMNDTSFQEIGERWRTGLDISGIESQIELLREEAFQALRSRGLGEEGLL